MVTHCEESPGASYSVRPSVIFNPDFFVEKLRHENPDAFLELVLSNITRLIDLPGTEFAQLLGEEGPKTPTTGNGGFFRSFNFLKRKDLHVEGLFRVPGNSVRQHALKELLNSGADVDLEAGDFHPNDVATLLKTFLGELPEPLLTHRHFHANRSLLKLLLDLLYHTAKQQDKNKMSAYNLALMFAPHVIWPRHDDLDLLAVSSSPAQRTALPLKRTAVLGPSSQEQYQSPAQQYTEEALKELFRHVHHNMPDSAKKKKLVRQNIYALIFLSYVQLVKQAHPGTPNEDHLVPPAASKKHPRSRSFGGLIKVRKECR
ncbi:hypothetical protein GOODEAATRI_017679 [Goodea atripinnis]|uniref:Rho-GAP domain-containing protein n=1 Tax=Goodea atripinnis TaxID=208336 RepID=A0ABV0N357_9TELE